MAILISIKRTCQLIKRRAACTGNREGMARLEAAMLTRRVLALAVAASATGLNIASFAPIALLFTSPELLAVNSALPVKSLQELVSYVKSKPGRINFASAGYGTQPHLLGEMLKSAADIDIVHVPYKGKAAAITDLLAGQVQIYFATPADILPHIGGGKVRVIAVADTVRFLQLPDVPTTVESGFPSLTAQVWSGILAPAGTSATVVDQLNLAINEIMLAPEARLALNQIGGQAKPGTPQDFKAFITMETQK